MIIERRIYILMMNRDLIGLILSPINNIFLFLFDCWLSLDSEIAVWEEKKKRLLREVTGLKQTQSQCKRSIHGWREYLQQLDARLAQQTANKESLERHNQHFQRQWQIHLEVRSFFFFLFLFWIRQMFHIRSTYQTPHCVARFVIQPFMDFINPTRSDQIQFIIKLVDRISISQVFREKSTLKKISKCFYGNFLKM